MILTLNKMIKLVFSLCCSVVKSVVSSCCWLQEELVDGVQGYRDLCTILCTASYRLNLPHQWTVNILSYLWELINWSMFEHFRIICDAVITDPGIMSISQQLINNEEMYFWTTNTIYESCPCRTEHSKVKLKMRNDSRFNSRW